MDLAVLSLIFLAIAIILSCISPINIGFLCMGFGYILALYGGIKINVLLNGFPTSLFLILVGVTLLFGQAQVNGTLEKITKLTMKLARGQAGLLPIMVFILCMALSAFAGNIAMMALIAPLAMAIAGEARISGVMMAVMVVNGCNAGGFSPIASAGLISAALSSKIGLPDFSWLTFGNLVLGNFIVCLLAYVFFGGLKLWKSTAKADTASFEVEPFDRKQWLTLGGIGLLVVAVVFFKLNVGFTAFFIATCLSMLGVAEESKVVKAVPWNAIMMICGVSIMMDAAGKAGGLDLFTTILANFSTPSTVTGVLGFVTGVLSVYSSSSGVIMPTFIPLVPGLIAKMGGGDPIAMVSAINLGAHLVDASPLSPGGALCIGAAAAWVDKQQMFKHLLLWGLSMSLVGAIVCWVLFTLL